jgi:5'-nucleotidase / UDP-sugar diphosphatase
MKKVTILMCVMATLCLVSLTQAQVDTLTILHVNDTHSHLMSYGPKDHNGNYTWGGMARLATLIGMNRMTEPNVMLLHGGDFCIGDFMFQEYLGIAELEIMRSLQYDALELGNHEFDLYPQTLEYMLSQAGFPGQGFPVLCANLNTDGDPVINNFIVPYTIKDYGDLRVGIFGLMTDLTNQISNPSPLVVTPPLAVAQAWVDSLRIGHNCDIVILLSHMGIDYDQAAAANISGIDIIVGGHSHTLIEQPIQIGSTLIVQADEFARYLGKLQVITNNGAIQSWHYDLLSVDSSVPQEPQMASLIATLAGGIEADPRFGPVYTQNISTATVDLDKPIGTGLVKDNSLGDMIADACRSLTGTDIAFQPEGFLSQTIYKGPVRGADIFQAVPYGFDQASGLGFKLATFTTDGMSIIAGLEFSVYNLPYAEDFFLHGSNIAFAYNLNSTPGSRVDYSSISINGAPINPSGIYTVTVPEGVVPFLTQIPGFNVSNLNMTSYFIYNVVKNYITTHSPLTYYADGRILDLALYSDPSAGVQGLSDVVTLFGKNGAIGNRCLINELTLNLNLVYRHLQHGRIQAARAGLRAFGLTVNLMSRLRMITPWGKSKLIYLSEKLIEALPHSFAKETDIQTDGIIPDQFELAQNYPNPFNPQTEIAYTLPTDTDVKLTVYDLLGQKIKVLVDDHENAGAQSVIWDGTNDKGDKVSSGIYFYNLQAGEKSDTKKMTLMK